MSLNVLQWFIQAGARVPVSENTSLTVGTALFSSARYWEGAVDWSHRFDSGWIDGLMTSRASYLHGSEGSRGNIQQVNYNDGFSLSVYRTAMTAADCNSRSAHRYSFNGCYKSTNVMLSVPFDQWYGTLGYALNRNRGRYVYRRELSDDDARNQAGVTRAFSMSNINLTTSLNAFMRDDSGFNGTDKGLFVTFSFSGDRNETGGDRRVPQWS